MCLSVAVARPDHVLATGTHAGHQWAVVHNGRGFRCGYVRVDKGHPWFGKSMHDLDADASVHGGITFADKDVPCDKGGADDGYWVGFDCAHAWDLPDQSLQVEEEEFRRLGKMMMDHPLDDSEIRTQEYVEAECRSLCEQAAAVCQAA